MGESFGATVRAARAERGFTLHAFARLIRVSPTFLSKVERNELNPTAVKTALISRQLGLPLDEMLELSASQDWGEKPLPSGRWIVCTRGRGCMIVDT